MSRGWVIFGVVVFCLLVVVGAVAHLRFREIPAPDENDGTWVFDHEEGLYVADRDGALPIGHKRFYKNKGGDIALEVYEVFGRIVVKIWQSPHGRIVELLDDNHKWQRATRDPEIDPIYEGGRVVAVHFTLWDVVGRRLIGRKSN